MKKMGLFFTFILVLNAGFCLSLATSNEAIYFKVLHYSLAIACSILGNYIFNQAHKD